MAPTARRCRMCSVCGSSFGVGLVRASQFLEKEYCIYLKNYSCGSSVRAGPSQVVLPTRLYQWEYLSYLQYSTFRLAVPDFDALWMEVPLLVLRTANKCSLSTYCECYRIQSSRSIWWTVCVARNLQGLCSLHCPGDRYGFEQL